MPGWIWIAFTVGAAGAQTVRNALQRSLTARLGTIGATHVRFLFGLPFGLALLALTAATTGLQGIAPSWAFAAWTSLGALTQVFATALMLAAMRERSFVVSTAYVKTEPVQIAVFGFAFLGESLGVAGTIAVLVATAGVLLMSIPAGGLPRGAAALRPALFGVGAGAMFALSAVGFRGAILALGEADFQVRATTTLAASLTLQAALLSVWLAVRAPQVLRAVLRAWRPSLLAGATGALASRMWFLAFALQPAAAVRTVGLVEILFAQAASRKVFAQHSSRRELAGIAPMVAGVAMLLLARLTS
ncbi:MAG: EamA family transporter [Burkholderiaceae bacterium]|nr:EamA family transporter [Burkholderiaceae bacterium]